MLFSLCASLLPMNEFLISILGSFINAYANDCWSHCGRGYVVFFGCYGRFDASHYMRICALAKSSYISWHLCLHLLS
jgi:hypothetical protein